MVDGEVRLAHRVRLPAQCVLDVRLRAGPRLFPVQEDGLLETSTRERFLQGRNEVRLAPSDSD